MKKSMKAFKIALNIIIWTFVAFSVFVTILVFAAQANSDGVPAIGGKCVINILTDSMDPTFSSGDLILSDMLDDEEKFGLQVGDIVSYYTDLNGDGNKEINTHRIVEIVYYNGEPVSYITQGDNKKTNMAADDPISCRDVICVYSGTRFGGIGGFLSFLQTSTGFLLIIVLPLVAVFAYELIKFIMTLMSVKNGGKKMISAADEELIKQRAIEEYLRQQQETDTAETKPVPTSEASPETDGEEIVSASAEQVDASEADADKEQ